MQDNEGVYTIFVVQVDTSLDQRRAGERRRRGRKRGRKKSRTGKRGKTAYVALPSSSRSCLILVPVLLPSSCAVPRRRSPLHDAVMYSMARHSTIMRATNSPRTRQGTSELVATWAEALCSIFPEHGSPTLLTLQNSSYFSPLVGSTFGGSHGEKRHRFSLPYSRRERKGVRDSRYFNLLRNM